MHLLSHHVNLWILTEWLYLVQAANEASTLGWGTRVKGFIICFVIGVTCSILVSGFEYVAFLYTIIYSITMCVCAYLRTTHF